MGKKKAKYTVYAFRGDKKPSLYIVSHNRHYHMAIGKIAVGSFGIKANDENHITIWWKGKRKITMPFFKTYWKEIGWL